MDSTDFLPTVCDVAGIKLPASPIVDGRSFLPQLRGEAGNPREWVYCWYSPRGEPLREMAFDQRFKLYRTGEFFDLTSDRDESKPLRVSDLLSDEAIIAAKRLQAALDQFNDARPAELPKRTPTGASSESGGKRTKKKASKNKTGDNL